MSTFKNHYWYHHVLLIFLFVSISACQNIVHFVAFAGGDGPVWPLPPSQTRLRYFESFDLVSGPATTIQAITGRESAPSLLFRPLHIAVKNSTIVTIDQERGTVQVYKDYTGQSFMLRTKEGQYLQGILDAALDDFGRIYVAEGLLARISIYDENGIYLKSFGSNLMWKKPERIALDPVRGRVYIADSFLSTVLVYSLEGVYLFSFGGNGKDLGKFNGLINLSVDTSGNIWILDTGNKRIQQFNARGMPITSLDLPADTIVEPVAITLEPDGTIYIADQYQESIHILGSDGKLITKIGVLGLEPGKFSGLSDIWFDSRTNRLYTAEKNYPRIQVFSRTETPWLPYP